MTQTATSNSVRSDQEYEAISPYLRRPLRSLKDYLRERPRSRQSQEATPAGHDKDHNHKEQDDPSDKGDQGDQ